VRVYSKGKEGELMIVFSDQMIKALNDFCLDHYKHFDFYPLEFEYDDVAYSFSEYWTYIDFDGIEQQTKGK
jgi:hypothetical protein